jgi:hypothetical protein
MFWMAAAVAALGALCAWRADRLDRAEQQAEALVTGANGPSYCEKDSSRA